MLILILDGFILAVVLKLRFKMLLLSEKSGKFRKILNSRMKNLKRDHPCACEIVTTDKYFEPNFKFIAELMQYTLHVVKRMQK